MELLLDAVRYDGTPFERSVSISAAVVEICTEPDDDRGGAVERVEAQVHQTARFLGELVEALQASGRLSPEEALELVNGFMPYGHQYRIGA